MSLWLKNVNKKLALSTVLIDLGNSYIYRECSVTAYLRELNENLESYG